MPQQVELKQKGKRKIITVVLVFLLLFQLPCFAFWRKSKKPVIDLNEKMDYVNINWWNNFSDPYLKYYIIQAIEHNHDAREASWKVEEYRQLVKVQFAQELPSISAGGSYIGLHIDKTMLLGRNNIFTVPFVASYEPDLLLKNHDKTKSSKKTYEASKFQEQSTYISLASDVATTYINILKFDKQIKLQQDLICVKKEEFCREQERYERGTTTIPKLNDAEKAYQSAKSALDELIKSRYQALTQLAVFIGETPNNIPCLKRNPFDCLEYQAQIPCAIPSDVVFSRPDILAAEKNLEKAKIDVKVARKEFLPRFNIIGAYAFTNLDGNFFNWDSAIAYLLASVTQDIFKGGKNFANLRVSKARYEQMFENYRQKDLNALKEVNDSLLIINHDTNIDKNTCTNLQIQEDNYSRARKSYKNGVISCPDLLYEREKLLTMEQNQTNSKTTRLIDYITLYKSVGGKL